MKIRTQAALIQVPTRLCNCHHHLMKNNPYFDLFCQEIPEKSVPLKSITEFSDLLHALKMILERPHPSWTTAVMLNDSEQL